MLHRQYSYLVSIAERIDPGLHATAISSLMPHFGEIVVDTAMTPRQYKVRVIVLYHFKERTLGSNSLLLRRRPSRSSYRLLYEVIKEYLVPHRF